MTLRFRSLLCGSFLFALFSISACINGEVTDSADLPIPDAMVCIESLDEGEEAEINRCAPTSLSGRYLLRIDDLFSSAPADSYRLFAYKTGFKDSLHPEPIEIPGHGGVLSIDLQLQDTDIPYQFELSWYRYSCMGGPCGYYWETFEGLANMGEDDKVLTYCLTKYFNDVGEVIRTHEEEMCTVIEPGLVMVAQALCFSEEPMDGIAIQKTYRIEEPSGQGFQESEQILIR